ncbi:hypothetical protein ACKKBF_B33965 [Auxenochlorella protothecoides x Auxenochlorella symbiontica]
MQLLVRGDRTCVVEVGQGATVQTLLQAACDREGSVPAHAARLVHGGRALDADASLASYAIASGATLQLVSRLRGGAGGFTVHPRLQRERWSLYWKETMATTTDLLDDIALDLDPATATPADVLTATAAAQGWAPVADLLALEGFEGPWERLLFQGRELEAGTPLTEQGVPAGAELTAVRLALVAEGWKIQADDDDLSSSSDDEAAFVQLHAHQRTGVRAQ